MTLTEQNPTLQATSSDLSLPDALGNIFSTAMVEAGHFYVRDGLSSEQLQGIAVGRQVIAALQDMGMQVSSCMFVDDFHLNGKDPHGTGAFKSENLSDPKVRDAIISASIESLQDTGFAPEKVYLENDFAAPAQALYHQLEQAGVLKHKKDGTVRLNGIVVLTSDGTPSCSLLDAATYLGKAQDLDGGLLVTVLPEKWERQQETTRAILAALNQKPPILNVYFSEGGELKVTFDF